MQCCASCSGVDNWLGGQWSYKNIPHCHLWLRQYINVFSDPQDVSEHNMLQINSLLSFMSVRWRCSAWLNDQFRRPYSKTTQWEPQCILVHRSQVRLKIKIWNAILEKSFKKSEAFFSQWSKSQHFVSRHSPITPQNLCNQNLSVFVFSKCFREYLRYFDFMHRPPLLPQPPFSIMW